uniref:Uncharacterized protein n=1 Tax=Kalanchoe fedtschenkoi TaxID=63787 RepID=A0A7N0VGD8_KALFE
MTYRVCDGSDRRSVIAMEEFVQIMESPMFLQAQRAHPHSYSPFSDSLGSRANYRPEPQPQLPFGDSFGLGHVQRHHHHHHQQQPQLMSLSDSFGHVQRGPEPRHLHYQQQQLQLSPSDSFGCAPQRLPEAHYSRAQAAEYDVVTEPVMRAEKHHSIREESIDREAGDFIKLTHQKFELSK